jgi:hypothetical protein
MSGKTQTGTRRRNPGVKGPNPHLKDLRRQEAEGVKGQNDCEEDGRNVKWARIGLADQLAILERKFPDGAKKQKDKIKAKIAKIPEKREPEPKKDQRDQKDRRPDQKGKKA